MRTLHLLLHESRRVNSTTTRCCTIERRDGTRLVESSVLWYELPILEGVPDDEDAEAFLMAAIMAGMTERRSVVVHGAVSRQLLSNLTEFRDAWHCWLPQQYARIDINVDQVRDPPPPQSNGGAIIAYSGGVDAAFSVWRHATSQLGFRTQPIKMCAMAHGLDIPLSDADAFQFASARAAEALKTLGVELVTVRTNLREIIHLDWEHTFATAVVSCLQQLKRLARVGIVASSEPYNSLVLPWGSSPVTDHLLSSSSFAVMHDGAAYSRTQKVAMLAAWSPGCANLRVCWQVGSKGRNCGRCEKCLRTMLNFVANGLPVPPCFPSRKVTPHQVRRIPLRNAAIQLEWRQILDEAARNNIRADWVRALRARLRLERIRMCVRAALSRGRALLLP